MAPKPPLGIDKYHCEDVGELIESFPRLYSREVSQIKVNHAGKLSHKRPRIASVLSCPSLW